MLRILHVGLLAGFLCIMHCSKDLTGENDNLGGGNGSGAGSARVSGVFFKPDGTTPASGAVVIVRDRQSTALVTVPFGKKSSIDAITTMTDARGYYFFSELDAGLYVIEGSDESGNIARHDSVYLDSTKEPLVLPSETLRPSGAITGSILLNNGNPLQTFVLIFGADRFCQLDTGSRFVFSGLAEGAYRIKIVSLDSRYGQFDTSGVAVKSADTTTIGTITLPLRSNKIPGLTAAYDTLSGTAKLVWSSVAGSKGYNIYRVPTSGNQIDMYIDFNNDPVNGSRLYTDTVFIDNLNDFEGWIFDEGTFAAFDYRITSVDSAGNPGAPSVSRHIDYVNSWVPMDTLFLNLPSSPLQLATAHTHTSRFMLAAGDDPDHLQLYFYSADGTSAESFDVPMQIADRSFSMGSLPDGEDPLGTIWYTAWSADTLFMCRLKADGSAYTPLALKHDGGMLAGNRFYQFDSTAVYYFDPTTGLQVKWMDFTNNNMIVGNLAGDGMGGIAVDLFGNGTRTIIHFSSQGTELKRLAIPDADGSLGLEGELTGVRDSVFHFTNRYYRIKNDGISLCGGIWFPYRYCDVWQMLRPDGTYAVLIKSDPGDIIPPPGLRRPLSGTVVTYRLRT